MIRRTRFTLALALVAAVLAVPATASSAGNAVVSGSFSSNADWISPAQITVYATVSAAPFFLPPPFTATCTVFVNVNQATGTTTGGSGAGNQTFPCDGQNHKVAIAVTPGPWQLGSALLIGEACGFSCSPIVQKQIKITRA
jgi:hypothetical protein